MSAIGRQVYGTKKRKKPDPAAERRAETARERRFRADAIKYGTRQRQAESAAAAKRVASESALDRQSRLDAAAMSRGMVVRKGAGAAKRGPGPGPASEAVRAGRMTRADEVYYKGLGIRVGTPQEQQDRTNFRKKMEMRRQQTLLKPKPVGTIKYTGPGGEKYSGPGPGMAQTPEQAQQYANIMGGAQKRTADFMRKESRIPARGPGRRAATGGHRPTVTDLLGPPSGGTDREKFLAGRGYSAGEIGGFKADPGMAAQRGVARDERLIRGAAGIAAGSGALDPARQVEMERMARGGPAGLPGAVAQPVAIPTAPPQPVQPQPAAIPPQVAAAPANQYMDPQAIADTLAEMGIVEQGIETGIIPGQDAAYRSNPQYNALQTELTRLLNARAAQTPAAVMESPLARMARGLPAEGPPQPVGPDYAQQIQQVEAQLQAMRAATGATETQMRPTVPIDIGGQQFDIANRYAGIAPNVQTQIEESRRQMIAGGQMSPQAQYFRDTNQRLARAGLPLITQAPAGSIGAMSDPQIAERQAYLSAQEQALTPPPPAPGADLAGGGRYQRIPPSPLEQSQLQSAELQRELTRKQISQMDQPGSPEYAAAAEDIQRRYTDVSGKHPGRMHMYGDSDIRRIQDLHDSLQAMLRDETNPKQAARFIKGSALWTELGDVEDQETAYAAQSPTWSAGRWFEKIAGEDKDKARYYTINSQIRDMINRYAGASGQAAQPAPAPAP